MQFFDWLWGKDEIGWLKTALLSGLFGAVIFGMSGGFSSSPSTNKFILIGLGVIPLLLIRTMYWSWRKENLREALVRRDPSARNALKALHWRKPEVASYLAAFVQPPGLQPVGNVRATPVSAAASSVHASTGHDSPEVPPVKYLGFGPYFSAHGEHDLANKAYAPARFYSQDKVWPGYLIVAGQTIGFFDDRDLNARSITEGSPVLLRMPEISHTRVSVPAGMVVDVPPGIGSEANHGGNLYVVLETVNDQTLNLAFDFAGSDDQAKARLQSFISDLMHRLST